ncbi:MAG: hypothetical protein CO184_00280 [Candidatus Zambryskibacteria bacterium CG_4_9_14_3_um_filter_40_16]|uniref:Uncharacterized protein n=2 Tax=Candidatus Zambryskiibacteriota TaxID=1817925 RepID=A0A2M7WV97_9BACT|nr:MAG: hypothetical protein CO184_00280 [Candidatus Zambryskibacteria bacterium CG_4_9_14_3_um_filter_40_16]
MESIGKKFQSGVVTLEIMIAFAVLILSISAVIMVVFGNQSIIIDTENNSEALRKAVFGLEEARARSGTDFYSIVTKTEKEFSGALEYTKTLLVENITRCKKQATSTVSWATNNQKTQKIELTTYLTNVAEALALGGDCASEKTNSGWNNPQIFASDNINTSKINTVDVLNGIAYFGTNDSPYIEIADTRNATLVQTGGLLVNFSNNFSASWPINDLDAIEWRNPSTGIIKNFVFVAIATSTNQLNIIDVTDIQNPSLVAERTLNNVDPDGSFPEGYKLFYYKDRLYIGTRETAGAEFHIFNVSDPTNPVEIGQGISLNITVNDIVIKEQNVNGDIKRFAYLATSQDSGELKVYDVTNFDNSGIITEISQAKQNLTGIQNGQSLYIVGNNLYFGRQSTSNGPDLYVYDISNPQLGLNLLGVGDVETAVTRIVGSGRFVFLATEKNGQEIQVWDISDSSNLSRIKNYNLSQISKLGIDYENNFLYAVGQTTPNFQMIYSPNI